MERSLQQSTTTFESARPRLVTSETFGCTPRAKFECCLVASSANGLVRTKDRHQEPSLNYVLLQAWGSGTSHLVRSPVLALLIGGVIPVAAQTELPRREDGHDSWLAGTTDDQREAKAEGRLRPHKRRETSRSDPGIGSRHAFETAPKYPTTHATCAAGNEGNGSLCQTRVCQPCWEHQGPRRLLGPHAGGRAR